MDVFVLAKINNLQPSRLFYDILNSKLNSLQRFA